MTLVHHPYTRDIEDKLGKEVVKVILDSARNGDISDSTLLSIARKLGEDLGGPNLVLGNHLRRMEREKHAESALLLKCILSDWYKEELLDLPCDKAVLKLIETFRDPDIGLRPLAKRLENSLKAEYSFRELGKTPCWRKSF